MFQKRHQEYRDRLEVEIEIINNMRFPDICLLFGDFVIVAKQMGIPVGPEGVQLQEV